MNPMGWGRFRRCRLCPWHCDVDRTAGETGRCGAGDTLKVARCAPHFGEEACLVGDKGSGAVFFSHCTLHCLFCQTSEISIGGEGIVADVRQLADCFLWLQEQGCHNLNWITPTHFLPHAVEALESARTRGLHLPVVYNCGGFESVEILRAMEGLVDIYLPDFKFWKDETAEELCGARDYPETARNAIFEMHRQVGELRLDARGRAVRGLLVRHLVLPGYLDESRNILDWLAQEVSPDVYVNLMGHYRPCHLARQHPGLRQSVTRAHYQSVRNYALQAGLHHLDTTHEELYPLIWGEDQDS